MQEGIGENWNKMSPSTFLLSTNWRQPITARIRRMAKVLFSQVCLFTREEGGLPQCQVLSEVSGPRSFPLSSWGRYPSPRFFPRSLVPGPFSGSTLLLAGGGTPVLPGGTPVLRQDWGTPMVRTGVSPGQDWSSPLGRTGVPHPPPPLWDRTPRVSNCYAAGGMPLPVTQDFLVSLEILFIWTYKRHLAVKCISNLGVMSTLGK